MRRRIRLYVADQLVDLSDESLILYNYTMEDLSNPTIVRNSYSQQLTLRGTPINNRIFGSAFRADRRINAEGGDYGSGFNPSRKTPFTIKNELNEILESGYVKLDSVTRKGADIEYRITLYGGLGAFFYALSYDDFGNKRTLADLNYLGGGANELDFFITKDAVEDAWDELYGGLLTDTVWKIINFAPAYNGIPDNFAADKALVNPNSVGLSGSITADGKTYSTKSNYALVNLAEQLDEWAVKDLRSYLQRPIFSIDAFLAAVSNPDNNGGYEVDMSSIESFVDFPYTNLWMTLPQLSTIKPKEDTSATGLTFSSSATTGNGVGRWDIVGSVLPGTKMTAHLSCRLQFNISGASSYNDLTPWAYQENGKTTYGRMTAFFIQAVAYSTNGIAVGGSKVMVYGVKDLATLPEKCSFTPWYPAEYERLPINTITRSSTAFEIPFNIGIDVEAYNVAYYRLMVAVYGGTSTAVAGGSYSETYSGNGMTSTPTLYVSYNNYFTASTARAVQTSNPSTLTIESSSSLRTGARVTKRMLLSSSRTPADYLLSFCKIFGLYFTYDSATKAVTVLRRNDLYQDETIDLTGRVDTSREITIQPLAYTAKWYDFILESDGGAYYDDYLNDHGIPYGIQRVNTGYDFNADSVNLMDSVVFKNAVTILDRSKYYNIITDGTTFIPSPFLDKGNTYTLWATDGSTLDTDISCPVRTVDIEYYNEDYPGYDSSSGRKLELRTADGKPLDGADVLVYAEGWCQYDRFQLTDDNIIMDTLNDGVPCWYLGGGTGYLRVPIFSRYKYGDLAIIEHSLDFGIPKELNIPGVRFSEDNPSVYNKGWKSYLADRYDANTKVMTCYVDLSGFQVNHSMLRKFYWYDNSLWVLNKIKNYSLCTYDSTECEFVQVQNKNNYLTGQDY